MPINRHYTTYNIHKANVPRIKPFHICFQKTFIILIVISMIYINFSFDKLMFFTVNRICTWLKCLIALSALNKIKLYYNAQYEFKYINTSECVLLFNCI